MSKEKLKGSKKSPTGVDDEDMDVGLDDLDGFFQNVSPQKEAGEISTETVKQIVQKELQGQQQESVSPESVKKLIQEQLQSVQPPPPEKKKKKKSLLTRKPGIYLSEKVDDRLDKEWRKQPRPSRKSKSQIVEEILRQYWGLPPLSD